MKKIIALMLAAIIAAFIFPHAAQSVLGTVSLVFGFSWPFVIVLGLLVMVDVIKIPRRSYEPRMSWWQAFKETVDAMCSGRLTDEFRQLN